MNKLSKLTIFVFCALLFVLMAYDVWTLAARGYDTTVSWTLYAASKDYPVISFVFGFFSGHLFWGNAKARDPNPYKDLNPKGER